jgi:hypothetical protein
MRVEGSGFPRPGQVGTAGSKETGAEPLAQSWTEQVFAPMARALLSMSPSERNEVRGLMKEVGEQADAMSPSLKQLLASHSSPMNFLLILQLGMADLAAKDDVATRMIGEATQQAVQSVGNWLNDINQKNQKIYMDQVATWSSDLGKGDKSQNDEASSKISIIMSQLNAAQSAYQSQTTTVQNTGSTLASTAQGLTQQSSADAQNFTQVCQLIQQILQAMQRASA